MRSEQDTNRAIAEYGDMVRRICMVHLKNVSDTQDIFQGVFLKYVLYEGIFESPEHEKAWLIRVSVNACRDHLKDFFRTHTVSIDEVIEQAGQKQEDYRHVYEAVLSLPDKYKDVIYLHYIEEYSCVEVAEILHRNVNTVYTLLARGKEMLKKSLGEEIDE
ncbi:MAG: sigma-70 family RNA polymerase sigma factor [Erysipelotrichia bacterium]|nr:sigma-70 family RNA polymerase sigma factor [Erysipelotrichia bacterium]